MAVTTQYPGLKSGYKLSDVGMIPEDWEVVLLDSVAKRGSGHTPDKKHPEYWDGDIKWISLKDSDRLDAVYITNTVAKITPTGIANSSAVLHPAGTVVLSRDAGVGKSAITTDVMAVSQHFMAWQCGPRLNNHFLYYWLQTEKPEFERIAMGNTIKTIGLPYFKSLKIPLPPLTEQCAMVTALSDFDRLITSLDRLITKKWNIKQVTAQLLLTGKTRLSGYGGDWPVTKLRDVATVLKGNGLSKDKVTPSGRMPCILYGELFTTYQRIIPEIVSHTDCIEGTPSCVGDVLVPGSTTTVGADLATASALLQSGVLLGGDINIIRPKSSAYIPAFLAYCLSETKRQAIAERAQGITIVHLYGRDLLDMEVSLPPLQEQTAIVNILTDMEAEITALERRREKTRAVKQGMMQELLTGRRRLV